MIKSKEQRNQNHPLSSFAINKHIAPVHFDYSKKMVDAVFDTSNNVILGNEHTSVILTSQSKNVERAKTGLAKESRPT